jgi:hypothetical protein
VIFLESIPVLPLTTHTSSIYFLLLDGVVVYVGQSSNWPARIGQHKANKSKNFDSFKVCELPYGANVDFSEFYEIAKRRPIYNLSMPYLDFLLTLSDVTELNKSNKELIDLDSPDYIVLMPNRVLKYWKMGGFDSYYKLLDECDHIIKKGDSND